MNSELMAKPNVFDSLLLGASPGISVARTGSGYAFFRVQVGTATDRLELPLGQVCGAKRFLACHRGSPFWMKPAAGEDVGRLPAEVQFLLLELADGRVAALVPLIDRKARASLQGAGDNRLTLVIETGDTTLQITEMIALFCMVGDDPYVLMEQAARIVNEHLGTGRLRMDKAMPAYADQFGWCTWNAFYQEVSQEKVATGLQSFKAGGVQPRMVILDDGWQSDHKTASGARQLTAFGANAKFPSGLAPLVHLAKDQFGVKTFMVWHTMVGYWGGVDGTALPGYGVREVARNSSPGVRSFAADQKDFWDQWWGQTVGLISPEHIHRFFHDYHRYLRSQGVDGVKVDNQAVLEMIAQGNGGRVALMLAYHEALEGSVNTHFAGNLINCMSCSSEMLYGAPASTITRTSEDFFPNPSSKTVHGLHLWCNAAVGLWFGQFVHPDWDIFVSGHPLGAYHAAGRAVSGSPVLISDKPGEQDFDLLRKLVLPDGTTLRCSGPGVPTRDCLFHDVMRENVLLKVFNRNPGGSAVLGVFNVHSSEDAAEKFPITGSVSPDGIPGLVGERFAVYAHHGRMLKIMTRHERWELTLTQLTAEVFTMVPVVDDFAAVGLPDMFNSGGAVLSHSVETSGAVRIQMRFGGRFLAYAAVAPREVRVNGSRVDFNFDAASGALEIAVAAIADPLLQIIR
ncbi:MAG: Sip1-related alpha-galactosidase [bacterium]